MVSRLLRLTVAMAALVPTTALAGPPFLTDGPEPVDTGHWEIYGPLVEAEGKGTEFAGSAGVEINYGAAPGLQISAEFALALSHDGNGMKWGAGDVGLSVKYRFYHDESAGLSVAVFPEIALPTASNGMGAGKVTGFLPVWIQKNAGPWSVFGGGGYAINPRDGNRNYWSGGIAVARQVTNKLLLGVEAERQGADVVGGNGSTRLGAGAMYRLKAPFRLLVSGGPTFDDGGATAGFHAFMALGLDF